MNVSPLSALMILYVDADAALRERTTDYLEKYGFGVVQAESLPEARRVLGLHRFDGVLIDPVLSEGDGVALIGEIAQRGHVGIVAASARFDETERVLLLEAGADYCLTKPLQERELVACLRASCRRAALPNRAKPTHRTASWGEWRIDLSAHTAWRAGQSVALTSGETAILRVLLERPMRVCSRQDLLAWTRRDEAEVFDRSVDVLVSRLRRKLEHDPDNPALIETIRGEGYRVLQPVVWEED